MRSEFDVAEEPKDRTPWIWVGIIVAVALMIGALLIWGNVKPNVSQVRIKHILISFDAQDPASRAEALETIRDLRQRIEQGESFERVAKEWSADSASAARGGDVGWEQRGRFDDAMEEYVWNAPISQVSEVIETKFGFHLVRIEDRYITPELQHELDIAERAKREEAAETR